MSDLKYYAYQDSNGIDADTIAPTPDRVRERLLTQCLGWRNEDQTDRGEKWKQLMERGQIIEVTITAKQT